MRLRGGTWRYRGYGRLKSMVWLGPGEALQKAEDGVKLKRPDSAGD